jgi:hypothetical protein
MSDINNKFSFWCPIEKAGEQILDPNTGEEIMRLGGIASTSDEDSDGEFLDPKGFDIKPLLKNGVVNWHHRAKDMPAAIIGEPTKAEIRPEGLYIETDLYPSSTVAHDVWELAKTLEHDSKNRRLGYSIEGKVVKRESNDPADPGYKHIVKAVITGVAITHMPKNPKTFANIIKGEIDEDFSEEVDDEENETEEKGLNTENGAALKKESLSGAQKFLTKSEVFDKLFHDIPNISIAKSEQVYSLIKAISDMAKRKNITEEDIVKAYETLGLEVPEIDVEKGKECGSDENDEDIVKSDEKEVDQEDAEQPYDEEPEDKESEEDDKDVKKGGEDRFDIIEKAITSVHSENLQYLKALGVMLKESTNKLEKAEESLALAQSQIEDLNSIVKAQDATIGELSSRIESFGAGGAHPKSLSHARPVERSFAKGMEDEFEKGGNSKNVLSVSRDSRAVSELLDQATFAKGYDDEFSKACMTFEASKTLPATIISRIKNEYGYEIIK